MLAVKRVKLPASGWLNRRDKPLTRRGMFPVKICEIHSLGRYSREVFINRRSSAYRTPRNGHAEKGGAYRFGAASGSRPSGGQMDEPKGFVRIVNSQTANSLIRANGTRCNCTPVQKPPPTLETRD